MPKRSDEEKNLIDSLAIIPADDKCNARTPKGYCRQVAGFGTSHVGTGRCKYHGGSSGGRPIVTGMYSRELTSTLHQEVERIATDPNFLSLVEELAVAKAMFADLVEKMSKEIAEDKDVWIGTKQTAYGSELVTHPRAAMFMKMVETLGKSFEKIVAAEEKMSKNLTWRTIMGVITQIKNNVNEYCMTCPVRSQLKKGINNINVPRSDEE
jgi:hypothetical protein